MVSEELKDKTVCVVGLGYVGLPLAGAFSKHVKTIGFEVNQKKVDEISGNNNNGNLICTTDPASITPP